MQRTRRRSRHASHRPRPSRVRRRGRTRCSRDRRPGEPVRLSRRLETADRVRREDPFEKRPDARVRQLRFERVQGGLRQHDEAQPRCVQAAEPREHVAMGGQRRQGTQDARLARLVERGSAALRDYIERRARDLAEWDVPAGERGRERRLQHEAEPRAPHLRVAERIGEERVEGAEIEHRLVHSRTTTAAPLTRSPVANPGSRAARRPGSSRSSRVRRRRWRRRRAGDRGRGSRAARPSAPRRPRRARAARL